MTSTAPVERTPVRLGAVQETMLITLWARASETRRRDAITCDAKAVELLGALEYDFSRFARGWKSQVGVAVRDRWIDAAARAYLDRHPDARVVNLGAGLDTRFHRLDNGRLRWFDVDLPDAIALRRGLLGDAERVRSIEGSALETAWMDPVRAAGDGPTLFIAEGVLMFFDRSDVQRLLDRVAEAFPGCTMLFDLIGPLMVRFPFLHDTLPQTQARFRWGARTMREIDGWSDRYVVTAVRSMLDECSRRWRWMRFCRFVPPLRRQFFVVQARARG